MIDDDQAATPTYELSQSINVSREDIRAVCFGRIFGEELLIAGSRDNTVHIFSRPEYGHKFNKKSVYKGHNNYVNAVHFMESNEDHKFGLVISSGSDRTIQCHEIYEENPKYTLIGHEDNVCCLDVSSKDCLIASGSWDSTIILWKYWQQLYVLRGHSYAVWSVLIMKEDFVISGSADRTIKMWSGGKLVKSIDAHQDCVRSLAKISSLKFASCSNDAVVRIWGIEGDCLRELSGHNSFIYSIRSVGENLLFSCGEDRSLVIWSKYKTVQRVIFPTTSLWSIAINSEESPDVAVGCSDGTIRLFSPHPTRYALAEEIKEFEDAAALYKINASSIEGIDPSKLFPPERLQTPGKPSQVIMIKEKEGVIAYQWSCDAWQRIGTVVDAIDEKKKQIFEGKEYDHVFDVQLDERSGSFKLPYNLKENPFTSAYNFLAKHELPFYHLDEVANFIVANTKRPQLPPDTTCSKDQDQQGAKFLFYEPINFDGISKKLVDSFSSFVPDLAEFIESRRFSSIPFMDILGRSKQEELFPVVDLLRYAVLHDEVFTGGFLQSYGDEMLRFFFSPGSTEWNGANLMMITRLFTNLFSTKCGRGFIRENKEVILGYFLQPNQPSGMKNSEVYFLLLNNMWWLLLNDAEKNKKLQQKISQLIQEKNFCNNEILNKISL